ncbi:hypothetical protein IM697_43490 [Streptomyces ferrugineus]|uniref:Uncharacterized protein n=1 Tax=Streptomyces ferrugineus TaxID=1413221 RepID=A0A7M2SL60_9ACTN|nr:hypothetical protein [Streptomyces ferrugineus]QOV36749.1 hypothetical protein IM697_43490 [Streptomyces ferrugineus]
MKIITATALAGAALLTSAVPASADDGPLDFGIFQGVNDTKGSGFTDSRVGWGQTNSESSETTPKSALGVLLDDLVTPGRL